MDVLFLGLFTADQNLKKSDKSTSTRQNPNGNRNGYECPEERDYYPYMHPTDWKDIAVLAENKSMCEYFQRESFNVKSKCKRSISIYFEGVLKIGIFCEKS